MIDSYFKTSDKLEQIFRIWKDVARSHGFKEIKPDLIQPVDLFKKYSGKEIYEQCFKFKHNNKTYCLVPDLTPVIAKDVKKACKVFCISKCFRKELTSPDRKNEFYQLNLDKFGPQSPKHDAEIINICIEILKKCKVKKFYVKVNNRKLLLSLLKGIGLNNNHIKLFTTILCKKCKYNIKNVLSSKGLSPAKINNLISILSISSLKNIEYDNLDIVGKEGYKELTELIDNLTNLGLKKHIKLDLSLFRDLKYYTSNIFEVYDSSNHYRSIAGGGRYENLVKNITGNNLPAFGFAMGDTVLRLLQNK